MKRRTMGVLLALVVTCWALPAAAFEDIVDGNERLFLPEFKSWHKVSDDRKGVARVIEYVPLGESVKNWTQRVSVTVLYGLRTLALRDYLRLNRPDLKKRCSRARVMKPRLFLQNDFEFAVYGVDCAGVRSSAETSGNSDRKFEFMMVKVIKGSRNFYIVQLTWHGDKRTDDDPPGSKAKMSAWNRFIESVELCDMKSPTATCRAVGIEPMALGDRPTTSDKSVLPYACGFLYQVSVVPDLGKKRGIPLTQLIPVGRRDLSLAGESGEKTEAALKATKVNAEGNGPVTILMWPDKKTFLGDVEKDLARIDRNAEILKTLLIVRGLDERRIVVRENASCRKK